MILEMSLEVAPAIPHCPVSQASAPGRLCRPVSQGGPPVGAGTAGCHYLRRRVPTCWLASCDAQSQRDHLNWAECHWGSGGPHALPRGKQCRRKGGRGPGRNVCLSEFSNLYHLDSRYKVGEAGKCLTAILRVFFSKFKS